MRDEIQLSLMMESDMRHFKEKCCHIEVHFRGRVSVVGVRGTGSVLSEFRLLLLIASSHVTVSRTSKPYWQSACFFLSSQKTCALYCCVIGQIITSCSPKIYSGPSHMVPIPHTRTDQVNSWWRLLTLMLASYPVESEPEHYFVLLTVNSLSHFCQLSDGARLGNDRSLPDTF